MSESIWVLTEKNSTTQTFEEHGRLHLDYMFSSEKEAAQSLKNLSLQNNPNWRYTRFSIADSGVTE